MLTSLTIAQTERMATLREGWITFALNLPQADANGALVYKAPPPIENLRENVNWIYELAKLPSPLIIEVESPLGAQYAANILKEMFADSKVRDQVFDQVRAQVNDQVLDQVSAQVLDQVLDQVRGQVSEQVRGQVFDQVRAQVRDQVRDQVRAQVNDQVSGQVSAQVLDQVRDQVRAQVSGQVRAQVSGQVREYFDPGYFYSGAGYDSGWTAFYEFFQEQGIVKNSAFDSWKEYVKSGIWDTIFLRGVCIVCRRPMAVRRDDKTRLHSLEKPAIKWADGYKLYYVAGVRVDAKVIEQPESITVEQITGERNAELRKALIQIIGVGEFLDRTKAEVLDEDTDRAGMPRRLLRFDSGQGAIWCCVEVECPSKRDKHYIWVPPDTKRCSQAIAWSFGFEVESEYRPLVEA